MSGAYEDDLAYIHDVGFGGFARGAAPGLLAILRKSGITSGLVVDLGCGSGIWARELVDAGFDVLGMDLSPAMIAMARRRVPEGDFRVGSFVEFDTPACRAVTAIGEVLNYLFDRRGGKDALMPLFERVYAALSPGGLFIFDVAEPGRSRGSPPRFFEGDDWALVTEYEHSSRHRRLTRRIVAFRKVGSLYRRHEEIHRLHLYRGAEIARLLQAAGFRVRTVRGYGKFRLPPALVGFMARKPPAQPTDKPRPAHA